MKLGDLLIRDTTRISITLGTFIIVVGAVITGSYVAATWKTIQEAEDKRLESLIVSEVAKREEDIAAINKQLDEVMPILMQNQNDMASIKTDLEWIKTTQTQILERLK